MNARLPNPMPDTRTPNIDRQDGQDISILSILLIHVEKKTEC